MKVLALYDVHGNVDALEASRVAKGSSTTRISLILAKDVQRADLESAGAFRFCADEITPLACANA